MKILYYNCFAGISGDMNLGALVDLGVDKDYLVNELKKVHLHGYEIKFEKGLKNGISGTRAKVTIEHTDHHHEDLEHKNHHHHHRSLSDIKKMIHESHLNNQVKELSIKIFELIGKAEAKIHNIPVENVHFHEIGAVDSIVDIVGAAVCIDYLKPDRIMSSTVELGGGFVHCAHGVFPVPAPATTEILQNIPVKTGAVAFETTTPTGAAILATCVNEFTDKTEFSIKKTGYGLGERDMEIPNVLRVYMAESVKNTKTEETATIIECNIDDMNPELYDYIFELLFKAGANDVYITPIIMKKSRPAVKLSVLCMERIVTSVEKILFEETSTLGLRKYRVDKVMLSRNIESLMTPYGEVRIKSAYLNEKVVRKKPEYEDCLKIAREQKLPLNQVYKMIEKLILD